jgi:small subunit ribosomal protein S15
MLTAKKKTTIIKNFQEHESDSGSAPVQAALLTEKIKYLTEHLQQNRKDFHSRKGLIKMVAKRKKLMAYLKKTDPQKYEETLKSLGLRA